MTKVDKQPAEEVYTRLKVGGPIMPALDDRLAVFMACFASMVDEDKPDDDQPAWVRERNRRQR